MEFFSALEAILTTARPDEKIARFSTFYEAYLQGRLSFDHDSSPKRFETPSFASICEIVDAKALPKRRSLSTKKGKAYLLHAIAHIEYSAIDLALDHSYRFSKMPAAYYDDWLKVAEEEIRHFRMLEALLLRVGSFYGAYPVHRFLFDISQKTLNLTDRMAVVPRYLETSGLDASPLVIGKLSRIGDGDAREIISALEVILKEEVDHVRKGDRWFRYGCKREGRDPGEYYEIVERYLPGAKKERSYVNVEGRKAAGFSCEEIGVLSSQPCDDQQ